METRDFQDQHGDGARLKKVFQGLSRPRWRRRDFRDQDGYGATQETARLKRGRRDRPGQRDQNALFKTFATEVETARLSRPRRRRRDQEPFHRDLSGSGANFRVQSGDGATFQAKAETARLFRPRRRRRNFTDRGGDGATKKQFFATVVNAARL